MPTRETAPVGAPCWIDLMTSDVEASKRFYTGLFGWTAEEASAEFEGYFMFTKNGIPVAGCMPAPPDSPVQNVWSTHLCTDDIEKTLAAATAEGGQVVFGPDPVGDLGFMSMIIDPSGASIGAWQPVQFQGFGLLFAPGAPCWHELHSTDYDAVLPFYRSVFRWETETVSDTPEFRYTTLAHGGRFLAGVVDDSNNLPAGATSHWLVYLGADPDRAVAKAPELGGRVVMEPADSPWGRMARLADPNGVEIMVMVGNVTEPETL